MRQSITCRQGRRRLLIAALLGLGAMALARIMPPFARLARGLKAQAREAMFYRKEGEA